MYELKISDRQWWCYDILGNIGWIVYYAGLILCIVKRPAFMQDAAISALIIIGGLLCAFVIMIGLIELVSERIKGLSRRLSKIRLFRGFGAITLGSLAGTVMSGGIFVFILLVDSSDHSGILYLGMMFGGALLCFVFVSLILKGFEKQRE